MINVFLFTMALVWYFIAAFLYIFFLVRQNRLVGQLAYWLVFLGWVVHSAFLIGRTIESGHAPMANLYESLSFFAWAIVGIYLLVEYVSHLRVVGAFVMPIAFFSAAAAAVLTNEPTPLLPALQSHWLTIHVTLSFLGYATFALAFSTSLIYLIQEREIKNRHPWVFYYRLPPLEVIDNLGYNLLAIGFPLFVLGIITGAIWAESAWGSYWSLDPKETWSLITALIYAGYFHARNIIGWRGRRTAYLIIVGFCAVIFTFIGVNLLTPGLHKYSFW